MRHLAFLVLLLPLMAHAQTCAIEKNEIKQGTGEWMVMGRPTEIAIGDELRAALMMTRVDSLYLLTATLMGAGIKDAHVAEGDSMLVLLDDQSGFWLQCTIRDDARAMPNDPGNHAINLQYIMGADAAGFLARQEAIAFRFKLSTSWQQGYVESVYDRKMVRRSVECVMQATKP